MTHLPPVDPATMPHLLAEVHRRLAVTPDMTRAMANSPALPKGYLDLSGALSRRVVDPATRERIAAARRPASDDPKTAAILAFAVAVNDNRGTVTREDLAAARAAGLSDEEIGHVALNVLTNYFNKAADVAIDFAAVAA